MKGQSAMLRIDKKAERTLEIMLVLITLALASILYSIEQSQVVVLNLFFLPVVIAGFYLGRYRAGILALLSVVAATTVIGIDIAQFSFVQSPITIALAVILWGAVLGLTAILVGSMSDERNLASLEAHEAHVGVVEVLSRYLQSADPALRHQAEEVNELSAQVGQRMKLPARDIDDIRVAALLMDVENIEITARVIKKAVGEFENDRSETNTFHGTELVKSLGSVLSGAFPLVLSQAKNWNGNAHRESPIGARILHSVRRYVELTKPSLTTGQLTPEQAINELRDDIDEGHDAAVLFVLEEIVCTRNATRSNGVDHKHVIATLTS